MILEFLLGVCMGHAVVKGAIKDVEKAEKKEEIKICKEIRNEYLAECTDKYNWFKLDKKDRTLKNFIKMLSSESKELLSIEYECEKTINEIKKY